MNRTLLASLTIKVAEKSMDMLMRAAILEGAGKVPRYSWMGRNTSMMGVHKTFEQAMAAMPNLNPIWTSRQETGMHLGLVKVLRQYAKDPELVDDMINEIVSGISLEKGNLGELYTVGKYLSDEIQNGADPRGAAALVKRHGAQRAISALRKKTEESLSMDTEEGGVRERDIPTSVDDTRLLGVVMADPQVQKVFLNTVRGRFNTAEGGLEIVNYWLEHPDDSNVEISKAMGVSGSYAGRIINKAREAFMNELQTNPKLQNLIEMIVDRENLGYGLKAAKKKSQ